MAMTLTKDKNYLVFTNKENKVYKFDMNKGVFISSKGNTLKNAPTGFASYMQNYTRKNTCVVEYMYRQHYYNGVPYGNMSKYVSQIMICDKLDSIGYKPNSWYRVNEEMLQFVDKHFKAFAKALKEDENISLNDFYNDYAKVGFFQELGLKEDEYYTHDILNLIWNWRNDFDNKQLNYIAYYLSRGVYDFFIDDENYYGNVPSRIFFNFFRWSELIEYTPTKDDFFKQYLMVKKNYRVHKAEFDNKAIANQLSKHNEVWDFENDEYIVVVPQTTDDFKDEANQQGNCVYSMYLSKVVNGHTNVVFIRKKDNPTKSHITCEVDNYGRIVQYLLKGNNRVQYGSSENDFRMAFEHHIQATWH